MLPSPPGHVLPGALPRYRWSHSVPRFLLLDCQKWKQHTCSHLAPKGVVLVPLDFDSAQHRRTPRPPVGRIRKQLGPLGPLGPIGAIGALMNRVRQPRPLVVLGPLGFNFCECHTGQIRTQVTSLQSRKWRIAGLRAASLLRLPYA